MEVIKRILSSRKLEVQTYRMCQGVLNFSKKYSKQALEETCRGRLLNWAKPLILSLKTRSRSLPTTLELPATAPP